MGSNLVSEAPFFRIFLLFLGETSNKPLPNRRSGIGRVEDLGTFSKVVPKHGNHWIPTIQYYTHHINYRNG